MKSFEILKAAVIVAAIVGAVVLSIYLLGGAGAVVVGAVVASLLSESQEGQTDGAKE